MGKKYLKISLIAIAVTFHVGLIIWNAIPKRSQFTQSVNMTDSSLTNKPVHRLFGIPVDSFTVQSNTVRRDQNLGSILEQFILPEKALIELMQHSTSSFDFRKIRQGNKYTAFLSKDTVNRLQYLVYEHSPVEYVVFDFTRNVKIDLKSKDIVTKQRKVTGEIKTSLWDAIKENNINPQVALQLSEMYAWTVDFFGLQQGDHFSVVYDENYVDTFSIGIGKVYAASFYHGGKELLAVPFVQDGKEAFYDAEGNSLRRAFLKAPLKFNRISSKFTASRYHPILKIRRPHFGVDYAAPVGTPVHSIGDGRIVSAGYEKGGGRTIKIRHNGVYTTTYMHLSNFAKGITSGKYVSQGELIGYVGSSGLSTGPHLDFRVYMNGSPIDPLKMESPSVDPVKPENMQAFEDIKIAAVDMLNDIEQRQSMEQVAEAGFIPKALQTSSFFPRLDN